VVGLGRVGESLARWLIDGGARLVCAARGQPSQPPPSWLPGDAQWARAEEVASQGQDLLLLAVPDDHLAGLVERLSARRQARVALHTSGSRGAEALAPLAGGGSAVGALHPLRAFPSPLPHWETARGAFWAIDGDPPARALAERLAHAWGGIPGLVEGRDRPLYHLAATLAAGGAVTLLASALDLVEELDLPEAVAVGFVELATGALEQATGAEGERRRGRAAGAPDRRGAAGAITGPVTRGEMGYLSQLTALRERRPELYPLVVLLALEALRQRSLTCGLGARALELERELRRLCFLPGFLDPLKK
jgi:predicted short-subunit dehydrogenase-like oxidoreductase (DUF2520 family)